MTPRWYKEKSTKLDKGRVAMGGDRRSRTVLIITTDDQYKDILLHGLQVVLGHRAVAVGTTEDFLEELTNDKQDLILLDLDPDPEGRLDFAGAFVASDIYKSLEPKIPIVALASDEKLRDDAIKTGCKALLAKRTPHGKLLHIRDLGNVLDQFFVEES